MSRTRLVPRFAASTAITLVALLASVFVLAVPARAAFPGDNGRIAYVGGDEQAPPGTRSDKALWLMNADGTQRARLMVIPDAADEESILTGIDNPSWSPDGRTIVADLLYSCPYGANCSNTVGVIDPLTGQSRALTCVHDVPNGIPTGDPARCATSEVGGTFSPDGTKIAYVDLHALEGTRIFVLDYAACLPSYQRALTCSKAPLTTINTEVGYDALSWSPDGQWIAARQLSAGGTRSDIVVVNTSSGAVINLTADLTSQGLNTFTSPDWSPDGAHLVVQGGSSGSGDQGLSILDVGCTPATCERTAARVLTATTRVFDPAFSPDGSRVAFTLSVTSGANEVWAINTDGTGSQRLTDQADGSVATSAANPGWQPVARTSSPPTVLSVSPGAGAAGVPLTPSVTATFDQPLSSFTLVLRTTAKKPAVVTGEVSCSMNCTVVTFTPDAKLKRMKTYRATVTGTNANGSATMSWSFTTRR